MKPLLAITMGDPAGVGPEIILKALSRYSVRRSIVPIVLGDLAYLRRVQSKILRGQPGGRLKLHGITPDHLTRDALLRSPSAGVAVLDFANVKQLAPGRASAEGGRASAAYIRAAIPLAMNKIVDGIVTAPINKVSFQRGGKAAGSIGHTEYLARLTGAKSVALMLVHGPLRVAHVTSHIPLKDVSGTLTIKRIARTIELTNAGLKQIGIRRPRLAVCGLNPHAGDGGLLGKEEQRLVAPAVRAARAKKIRVEGPFPSDTLWGKVLAGRYDAGIALYHDQGQIPIKLTSFRWQRTGPASVGGVNVTLGLPIIRTSVAHGTAFDIAGKGVASEVSLIEAVNLARKMVIIARHAT